MFRFHEKPKLAFIQRQAYYLVIPGLTLYSNNSFTKQTFHNVSGPVFEWCDPIYKTVAQQIYTLFRSGRLQNMFIIKHFNTLSITSLFFLTEPKPKPKCHYSEFGCCWDKKSPAKGPSWEGCPACKDTYKGCQRLMNMYLKSGTSREDACTLSVMIKHCPKICGFCGKSGFLQERTNLAQFSNLIAPQESHALLDTLENKRFFGNESF